MTDTSYSHPGSQRGANVLLVDIQDDVLDKAHAELNAIGPTKRLVADLRDPDSAGRIGAAAVEVDGAIGCLR